MADEKKTESTEITKDNKNAKRIGVLVCCAVLFAAAAVVVMLTSPKPQDGVKSFTLEIYSERDGENSSASFTSDMDFFGQWCRTQDYIDYNESEYGIYITSVKGFSEDIDNQYWWCVMENGADTTVGADSLPLSDGSVYRLELRQGW